MRITYVVHQFLPRYFTGTEQYTFAVARHAQSQGHEVEVFTLEPDFSEREPLFEQLHESVDGLSVTRVRVWTHLDRDFERMEYRHPFVAERFRRHLEQSRPDIVHVFHLRYLGAGLIDESKSLGIPVVVHLMDFWFLCPAVVLRKADGTLCDGPPDGGLGCLDCVRPGLGAEIDRDGLRDAIGRTKDLMPVGSTPVGTPHSRVTTLTERPRVLRRALLAADRVIAPSRFLRSVFVRNGIPEHRISVLPYGLDPERLSTIVRQERAPGAPLRVGFIGSIAEHKGTDLLIDAVATAAEPMRLRVFGRVDAHDAWANAQVTRTRMHASVEFVGPFPRAELGRVLGDMDVLVVPSRWYENTPFVALEALAARVPVVAADLGGLAESVRDGVDGELFRPGDVADLRTRLERLARERERLTRYRANIRPVKTIAESGDEILAVYAELAQPARPS